MMYVYVNKELELNKEHELESDSLIIGIYAAGIYCCRCLFFMYVLL